MHRGADLLDADRDHGIEHVVERVAEGRDEDDLTGGTRLVDVVHDLRIPLDEEDAVLVRRLGHVHRDRVAIIIVTDVFVVEARECLEGALGDVFFAHVPVGDELDTVGIRDGHEQDHVVEETHGFRIGAAGHLVNHLGERLGVHRLGGVEAAVDPDDGFAFFGEFLRFVVGEALGAGEAHGDVAVVFELLVILGRGDDRHVLRAAFGGVADADDLQAITLGLPLF